MFLRMFFTFQRVIFNLPLAFRVVGKVFPLHTHSHAHTRTHTLVFICYNIGLQLPVSISCFLVALIKHIQYKKSNSLVGISNFSKTKGLSGNQALNKSSSNVKEQKTSSIQFK